MRNIREETVDFYEIVMAWVLCIKTIHNIKIKSNIPLHQINVSIWLDAEDGFVSGKQIVTILKYF